MPEVTRRRWLTGTIVVVGVCFGATYARAQVLPDPMDFGTVYEQLAFEAADTDGNNLISEAEFVRDAAAAFAGLDANHDGKLTPEELRAGDPITYDALPGAFAKIDVNRDGVLTFDEVMAYKMKAFRAADKNQDGSLSFNEMVDAVRAEVGK